MRLILVLMVGSAAACVACASQSTERIAAFESAAENALADGQAQAAIAYLKAAIPAAAGAEYADLMIIRGRALLTVGRAAEGEQELTRAIGLNDKNPAGYRYRAVARLMQGQGAAAHQDIQRAIELQPLDPTHELVRGQILTQLQDYEGAVAALGRCIAAMPEYSKPYVARGNAYIQLQRHAEALNDFNAAVALHSTPEALFNRGVLLAEAMNNRAAGCADLRAAVASGALPPVAINKAATLCGLPAPAAGGVVL